MTARILKAIAALALAGSLSACAVYPVDGPVYSGGYGGSYARPYAYGGYARPYSYGGYARPYGFGGYGRGGYGRGGYGYGRGGHGGWR